MHLTVGGAGPADLADRAGRLHRSSTCCGSTATRCSSCPTRTAARCWPSSSSTGPGVADARATTWATAQACSRPPRRRGWKGIVAKRLDCPYVPGRRSQRLGEGQEQEDRPTWWSAAGCRGEGGRAGRLGALVVGFYEDGEFALRRPRRAPASPRPSSSACRACSSRARATTSPFTAGPKPAEAGAVRRARAGRERRVLRHDQRRHAPPSRLQGAARRHRAGGRRPARMTSLRHRRPRSARM